MARVRGNRRGVRQSSAWDGFIPACTGETDGLRRDYIAPPGLSPRVRGNRGASGWWSTARGSIPACTGKPMASFMAVGALKVYPRVYGETRTDFCSAQPCVGLSPRVRGNRLVYVPERGEHGSYPRVYGETAEPLSICATLTGLSPRVRGNLAQVEGAVGAPGSIPACTGKPPRSTSRPRRFRVYPRVYGETPPEARPPRASPGLSPRVRGNQSLRENPTPRQGSIPACTGKPEPS